MGISVSGVPLSSLATSGAYTKTTQFTAEARMSISTRDTVELGAGTPLSPEDAIRVVNERAMNRIREAVDAARQELGLPEGATLDTSAEATATRIADFALKAFDVWRKNHGELGDDEARAQFAKFIGGAIQQGIGEAKDILNALGALNGETENKITAISDLIQKRLDAFVRGGAEKSESLV